MEEFLDFVATLRSNNWNIPVLVGGDFNMDMKSYDLSSHTHLNIVPYRSGPSLSSRVEHSRSEIQKREIPPTRSILSLSVCCFGYRV